MNTRILILASLVATAPLVALAEQQPDAKPPVTTADTSAAAKPAADAVSVKDSTAPAAAPTKGKDSAGQDTLSVDFPDEDIRNILRNVADLFDLNLVIPETLQGKTSVKLHDVTWRQIFQVVLDPVGYTYIEEGNIIKIISKEAVDQEPVSTDVFILNYAKAQDIQPTITSLVDPAKGKLVVDTRSNSLVITERPSRMARIRPIIEQLDKATDQVMIESKFVETTDSNAKNLGLNWTSLNAFNMTATPGGTGIFNYTKTYGNSVEPTVNKLQTTTGLTPWPPVQDIVTSDVIPAATSTNAWSAVVSSDQFKVILSALEQLNNTKIISNPTVVTLNNTEASINVAEEDPIPNYTFNQQTGTFEVSGFNYKDIGIILKVTPQVNARGFIKLTLAPEVSQKNGYASFGGAAGTQIPIIATRKATTQVSLKDGYTMAIGGLISSNGSKVTNKVPILGSIPVLGYLFKNTNDSKDTDNLIIFITAKTISAEGAPVEQIFNSKDLREMGLNKSDLPGTRDAGSPFIEDSLPKQAPAK